MFLTFLFLLPLINSFRIKYYRKVPFIAEIYNLNINNIDMQEQAELQYLFKSTPVLIFKNQTLTPQEHYNFCCLFDKRHTDNIVHPFKETQVPECPQLALRGKGWIHDTFGVKNKDIVNGQTFKYNPVWHQDLVGVKNKLPTIVSSMYVLEIPEKGGATLFASLEKGYENLSSNLKYAKYMNLQCCYSTIKALDAQIDHTGYGRIDKYWAKDLKDFANVIQDLVVQPLVIYPDSKSMKKTLMISPNKFYNFLGFTPDKSQEIMREILNSCVFVENNTERVNYEKNDLLIFNNRKVIHSTTPKEEIEGTIIYSLLFLDTQEKFTYSIFN